MKLLADEDEEAFLVDMASMNTPKYQAKKDNSLNNQDDSYYQEKNEFAIEILHIIRTSQQNTLI
jgi:hypothetical protein